MMPFHPWIDGDLLTAPAFRAALAPLPLVVSTTANEMELFRDQVPVLPEDIALGFLATKAATLGITDESSVRAGLQACNGDLVEAIADLDLHVPNELMAHAHRARGQPAWRARFNWEAPNLGACHALDLPFDFGTLDVAGWRDFAGAHHQSADDLSARMRQAWCSFATTGEPSDAVIGAWPQDQLVGLGPDATVGADAVERRLAAWLGEAPTPMSALRWSSCDRDRGQPRHRQGLCARTGCRGRDGLRHRSLGERVRSSTSRNDRSDGERDRRARRYGDRGRVRPSRRCSRRRSVRSRGRGARSARHSGEQHVHRDERAHVGPPVLGSAPVELGRHDRRRHTVGVHRERLRRAADGSRTKRSRREHQRVGRRRVRLERGVRRRQVRTRPHHGRHRARARARTT